MPDATRTELTLSVVTAEEDDPLENEDESGRRLCEYLRTIFQAREEGPRHHQDDEISRIVQQAPDDINLTVDNAEFDDLLALKKETQLLTLTEFITVSTVVLLALVRSFLFHAYQAVFVGSTIPDRFAESKTVFIPKTSDTDDLGSIIRYSDALRPLT